MKTDDIPLVMAGLEARIMVLEEMLEQLKTDLPRAIGARVLLSTDGTVKMRLVLEGNSIDFSTIGWPEGEVSGVSPIKVSKRR